MELRLTRSAESGATVHILAMPDDATVLVQVGGEAELGTVAAERMAELIRLLDGLGVALCPAVGSAQLADSYALTVREGISEAVYSWTGTAPAGWEALDRVAEAILQLGRQVSNAYALR